MANDIIINDNFNQEVERFVNSSRQRGFLDLRREAPFALMVPKNKKLTELFGGNKTVPIRNMLITSVGDGVGFNGKWGGESLMQYEVWLLGDTDSLKFLRAISGASRKPLQGSFIVTKYTTLNSKINKKGKKEAQSSMVYEFSGVNGGQWNMLCGENLIVVKARVTGFTLTNKDRTGMGQKGKSRMRRSVSIFSSAVNPTNKLRK
jgi:hypothetical protein